MGLTTAILISVMLASKDTKDEKLSPRLYIDCFINGGIVIASFQDIAQDPVVGMICALLSTLLTLILHKYYLTSS